MNRRIYLFIILAMFGIICFAGTNIYAGINITADGATSRTSVSSAFDMCYQMKYNESLGVNQLDPHLTTNYDWGCAAIFGLSQYGDVTNQYGSVTKVGEKYTLNGNETGIMDFGSVNSTSEEFHVAETNSTGTSFPDGVTISAQKSKYILKKNNLDKHMLFRTWFGASSSHHTGSTYVNVRLNITGADWFSTNYSGNFRPVIWNIDR